MVLLVVSVFLATLSLTAGDHSEDTLAPIGNKDKLSAMKKRMTANVLDNLIVAETCENDYAQLENLVHKYINRYINVFLFASGIQDDDLLEEAGDENLFFKLKFRVTTKELVALKNMSKKSKKLLDQLVEIDAMLSNGLKVDSEEFSDERHIWATLEELTEFCKSKWKYLSYLVACIGASLYCARTNTSRIQLLFWLFMFLGVFDGVQRYFHELEEARIEDNHELGMMEGCKEEGFSLLRMFGFGEDKCLAYKKKLVITKESKVSLLKCILKTFIGYPSEVMAFSVRQFSQHALQDMNHIASSMLYVPFMFAGMGVMLVTVVLIMRPRVKLGLFGFRFEVDLGPRRQDSPQGIKEQKYQTLTEPCERKARPRSLSQPSRKSLNYRTRSEVREPETED